MKRLEFMTSVGCLMMLVAFGKQAESQSDLVKVAASGVHQESKEPRETTKTATEQKGEEYRKQIEKKLAEFGERVKALKAEAEKAEGKAKTRLREAVKELDKKMAGAKKQFEKFKSASARTWERAKSKMDAVIKELERAYEQAAD